jgi:hypothetical protein
MPVTAKLSKQLYERLGEAVTPRLARGRLWRLTWTQHTNLISAR